MTSLNEEFSVASVSRPQKCLTGVSIMLVDDSRSVSEAVRLMATASGARIRRADCIASAQRHLMLFRPDVVIADLGLPDGNGVEIAKIVSDKLDPRPGLLIISGAGEEVAQKATEECGADNYLLKPIDSLGAFQAAVLGVVPNGGPALPDWNSKFTANLTGTDFYEQDLENALDLFEEAIREDDQAELAFGAQFLAGVASTASDPELENCARAVMKRISDGHKGMAAAGAAIKLLNLRLESGLSATG